MAVWGSRFRVSVCIHGVLNHADRLGREPAQELRGVKSISLADPRHEKRDPSRVHDPCLFCFQGIQDPRPLEAPEWGRGVHRELGRQ